MKSISWCIYFPKQSNDNTNYGIVIYQSQESALFKQQLYSVKRGLLLLPVKETQKEDVRETRQP